MEFYSKGQEILAGMRKTRDYFRFKPVAVEEEMRLVLGNGVGIKGIVDLIIERGRKTIEVIDFKSGERPLPPDYLKRDIQLAIYSLLVRRRFGDRYSNILITVDPLQYSPQTIEGVDIGDDDLAAYLKGVYNAIFVNGNFAPRLGRACGYCNFTEDCPLMKELDEKKIRIVRRLDREDDQSMAEEFFRLNAMRKVADRRLSGIRDYFQNLLGNRDHMAFSWGSVTRGPRGLSIIDKQGANRT
jgi:hypothetical protein